MSNFYRFSFPEVSDTVTVEEPDPVEIVDEPVKDPEPSLDLLTHTEVSDRFLVSKEIVVLRPWESETKILVLTHGVINVELPP